MEPLNGMTILEKLTQLKAILALQISTAFMGFTTAHVGIMVLTKKEFIDVETSEKFEVWSGVRGFRLFLVSKLL